MTIPIRNVYYLFLYAWARFTGGAAKEVGIDDSPDLPNLFARLLLVGTRRQLRRGLYRGYEIFTEETIRPRGRLRLDRMIKEATVLRGTAICDLDELTHDVLHNQIIKATLAALSQSGDVERETRHELRLLVKKFVDVQEIRLSAETFRRLSTSRINRDYVLLLRLCEFVFRSLMPDERGVGVRFQSVLDDEGRMSIVFEDFLRNFLQHHYKSYRVKKESSEWDVGEASIEDMALLPRMITDITMREPHRSIIIDAKFYKEPLAKGPYGERVRANHLYQLVTYLQHERVRRQHALLSGMLIYAGVGRSLRLRYRLLGVNVLVASLDLAKRWQEIEDEIHELMAQCEGAAVDS